MSLRAERGKKSLILDRQLVTQLQFKHILSVVAGLLFSGMYEGSLDATGYAGAGRTIGYKFDRRAYSTQS